MRLIDKDALIDTLRYHFDCTYMSACTSVAECLTRRHEIQYCTNKVEQAIEIDAVPVVRCGECKFRNTSWYDKRDVLESFCRWDRDESPNDDDYCSYGERRK